jgi:serine protease Do
MEVLPLTMFNSLRALRHWSVALTLLLAVSGNGFAGQGEPLRVGVDDHRRGGPDLVQQADYHIAERWFRSLGYDERTVIQLALIWAGGYRGLADGEFGQGTFAAIKAYQHSIGSIPNGVLSREERYTLVTKAASLMKELGFEVVTDEATGLKLGLPLALVSSSGPTRRGFAWAAADGSIEIESVSVPVAEQTYLELYERLSRAGDDRRIAYRTVKPDFFVISGDTGGRKFYLRFLAGPAATRGFSLVWDRSLSPDLDQTAVAMSSMLTSDDSAVAPVDQDLTWASVAPRQVRGVPSLRGESARSSATGFFISSAGHLVTNDHVIESCHETAVRMADGTIARATVLARTKEDDLALLKVDLKPPAVARFRKGHSVRLGESVVIFGFPLVGSLGTSSGLLTAGHISALAGPEDHPDILQMTAPVQSGSSGGPLLDQSGNVIGVVAWKAGLRVAEGTIEVLQNMNFAIKSTVVTNLLEARGVPYLSAPSNSESSVTEIAEAVQKYTAMVVCR